MEKIYHFIGIGGVSMSALAKLLHSQGNIITGSDITPTTKLDFATVFHDHNPQNVKPADVVVFNNAIDSNNPELLEAKKLGKKIISRGDLLGEISRNYKNVIAISGMHGKSTTTEMIAEVFLRAGKNPTIHLGAVSKKFNSNLFIGRKDYFITEACEYGDSFLSLNPNLSVVLNIEAEHMDYFKCFSNIKKSFQFFLNQSEKTIIHKNFKNIIQNKNKIIYDLFYKQKFRGKVVLNSIIEKNVENSLACFLVCKHFKIDDRYFFSAMKKFKGTNRRMEVLNQNPLLIEDYAHHPTEIKAVVDSVKAQYFSQKNNHTLKNKSSKKLCVIFQPHTYSRTKEFFSEFVEILSQVDCVGILETFSAREKIIQGATGFDIFKALKNYFSPDSVHYFQNIYEVKRFLNSISDEYITLYLGAGESLKNI